MPVGSRTSVDVLQTQYFMFEAAGKMTGFFTKCSGLSSENSVIEEKRMADGFKEIIHKQPGRLKWGELKLERGITDNMDMWAWRKEVTTGKVATARTNCSLILFTHDGTEAARWNIVNAWPSKVEGPSFKSDDDKVGIESVTLVFETFIRES